MPELLLSEAQQKKLREMFAGPSTATVENDVITVKIASKRIELVQIPASNKQKNQLGALFTGEVLDVSKDATDVTIIIRKKETSLLNQSILENKNPSEILVAKPLEVTPNEPSSIDSETQY